MNYLPSNLEFKDGVAFIGETSLLDIVKEHGTPLYVYDWEHLRDNIDYFTNAFGEETYFRYAAKAFICKALVKELDDKGWGVDVVSGGEMATVHAEQNAICDCSKRGVSTLNCTAYITHYPCLICMRLLLASGIKEIKYIYDYKNDELVDIFAKQLNVNIRKMKF